VQPKVGEMPVVASIDTFIKWQPFARYHW